MKLKNYKNVIFDLGGVIININYNKTVNAFKKLGAESLDVVYSQKEQSSVFDLYETGKISSQEFINRILSHLPANTSPNQVVSAWNAMILDFPKRKLELLENVSKSQTIYLLSNTNDIHVEFARRQLQKVSTRSLESYFQKTYLSQEIGMRKPHPETFQFVCDNANIDPSETIFIDDSIQHIEGAKTVGLNTYHLTNPEELYSLFS